MKIQIESVSHNAQRYETCGDWWFQPDGSMEIKVSHTTPEYDLLIALHEFVEASLCKQALIPESAITKYDLDFELKRERNPEKYKDKEPGDNPKAPYFAQHKAATSLEKRFAKMLNVDWGKYEKTINALSQSGESMDAPAKI